MKKENYAENYSFTGLLYLPNHEPLELNGEFDVDNMSLEGKMNCELGLRDTIQGNLVNGQRFNVPGCEENPMNFLLFAHFSNEFPNHHYFLAKKGNDFEGQYIGRADLDGGKVKGINTKLYPSMIKYADLYLNEENQPKVEIELFKK